ncbi:tRNA uridine-5-carboxymethylaminomethyl(34) synthesis enzyme MnmG [candidate division KSB1 bacterium]|nr:tRNA uridine-5-carboxymethylaminomethyl(34) synthesis enzyme MnmG [candidate division KSB1 bacterium]
MDCENKYDVIVIGAGHAGCEAALAAARMGASTLLVTINIFTIAQMSCNPAIGGLAKGHLVKELDVLGGQMGIVADDSAIQFKVLNRSKGPAVWSLRSQNDRIQYANIMRQILENQPNLYLRQHDVKELIFAGKRVAGIVTEIGTQIWGGAVILAAGTFLNGKIHVGLRNVRGGRSGEIASSGLSEQLAACGFQVGRLKTGTPPRIDGRTIDFSAMEIQPGDSDPVPFSHKHEKIELEQIPCYLTRTTARTHELLRSGLDRSPLYAGIIEGIGPRYCPSVEDKVVRFADKESHQLFLEPEGRGTREYYLNGFATSLPEDIQVKAVRSVPGLEKARLTRLGYAIEYDYFPPSQLRPTLETKLYENLYFVGQINGTSGYEEAAVQGFIAAVNAVLKLRREEPFVLGRSEAYIGVLIDDLVTKDVLEPYRMFTSRAEYRLLLRQDNADLRLMSYGYRFGLIDSNTHSTMLAMKERIAESIAFLKRERPSVRDANEILEKVGSARIENGESLQRLLKRPELHLTDFAPLYADELFNATDSHFWRRVREQVEIDIKYEGFLQRQNEQIKKMVEFEELTIPMEFDYREVTAISTEGREKLMRFRPLTLGQASRILGVSPADIAVLMMILSRLNRN